MLRRLASSVLRWGLAGILGATSLLGGELHEIFGIHHAGQCGRRGCESSGLAGQQAVSVTAGSAESCHDEANCPICNYLAQGRTVGERFEGLAVTANMPNQSPAIPLCLPTAHLQPFQARAPPAA
jgi:hypothetical protein